VEFAEQTLDYRVHGGSWLGRAHSAVVKF